MKKLIIIPMLLLLLHSSGQQYEFFSPQTIDFYSEAVGESFKIDVQIPENYFLSAENVTFPLIILLDQQNEFTYSYNLHSIEMLIFHSQMPQPIVAGIPFNMQNRLSLTSLEDFYGIEGRIERTEEFIFDELIPHLKSQFRAGAPVLIFGHSRTGFLTSYFMINRSDEFEMAGSFSSFFEKGFELTDFSNFLEKRKNGTKPFTYYFSAGTQTNEEEHYLKDLQQLDKLLTNSKTPDNFEWQFFQHPFANHITNYNLSVTVALTQYFGIYNRLLDVWLFEKLKHGLPENPQLELSADFEAISSHYNAQIFPDFVHIYSIASALTNEDPEAALEVYIYGKSFYRYDHELDHAIISLMLETGQKERAQNWLQTAGDAINSNPHISDAEKEALIAALESLIE